MNKHSLSTLPPAAVNLVTATLDRRGRKLTKSQLAAIGAVIVADRISVCLLPAHVAKILDVSVTYVHRALELSPEERRAVCAGARELSDLASASPHEQLTKIAAELGC